MKVGFLKSYSRLAGITTAILVLALAILSCEDKNTYDDTEPEWLGESIYDYLEQDGSYTNFVRLINDVNYKSVLEKTGSKTLFVARDEAFDRFYQNNDWGVSGYEDLTLSQKNLILNYNLLDNAYLIETLSNYFGGGGLVEGTAMRRETSSSALDSVPFRKGDRLPDNEWWNRFKDEGLYLLNDETVTSIVYFFERQMNITGITNSDFKILTGSDREIGDAHVFDTKIIERDITCKNGYIHVLEDVLLPQINMAEYVFKNENTQTFSNLLHRYCAPYYLPGLTNNYRIINPEFNDSIFAMGFFAPSGNGGTNFYPDNRPVSPELMLAFDPGWNSYTNNNNAAFQSDMAAMLVPTDDAMLNYINSGAGTILKERFGTWENIPDRIIVKLLNRHMRPSFIESVPSKFDKLRDSENSPIPIQSGHVVDSYVGINGVVYQTSEVYPPNDYVSVYAPVLFSSNSRVFNWAIEQLDFNFYLNSLVSRYSFFVPTDEYFSNYLDPVAWGKDVKGALKFWYNTRTSSVNATVYTYDAETKMQGDSVNVITDPGFIRDRLLRLLDSHIVVNGVEGGSGYYLTKGVNLIKVEGSGQNMKIQGGYDISQNEQINVVSGGVYKQDNGHTYFIDKPIQTPLSSIYETLSTTPEFSEFFSLLAGFPQTSTSSIFVNNNGIDFNVKFLNTFHYTLYIPTNEAINQAIEDGVIPVWESREGIVGINDMENQADKASAIVQLERFLRYHFQDNSVFISDNQPVSKVYQTATIKNNGGITRFNTFTNKYLKLGIEGDGTGLELTTEIADELYTASVITNNGLYNILTQDYVFEPVSINQFMEIDGSGTGQAFSTSGISTSSTAVIHQIDKVLRFE